MSEESKETAAAAAALWPKADKSLLDVAVPEPSSTLGGGTGVDEAPNPGIITHILKSLRPGQDLTRITIPSFFLEPRSLLEKMADSMMHPHLLLELPKLDDPVARMKQFCKWYLSGWHYKTVGVKKPYNPVIGETFACIWKHDDGSVSQYFAEQVSHRPPISALHFENRQRNVVIHSQVWTKSRFKAPQTALSIMEGGSSLYVLNRNEEYRWTFPNFYANGLLVGTLRMEMGDTVSIVCEKTKLQATFEFKQKPTFGGEFHLVSGYISQSDTGRKLFTIEGKWTERFNITDCATGATSLFLDVTTEPIAPKLVLPLEQQGPWESRRVWVSVTNMMAMRPTVDWTRVDREKLAIEDAQRLLPCHHHTDPQPWATKVFHERMHYNAVTKTEEPMWLFDYLRTTPYSPDEVPANMLWLSRTLPDPRIEDGDAAGAGAGAGAAAGAAAGADDEEELHSSEEGEEAEDTVGDDAGDH